MKRILMLLLAVAVTVAFSGMTFAAEEAKKAEPAKAAAPAAKTVTKGSGEVTAVDANAKTITVKTKKGEVVISITENSKITVGKETKTLDQVKAGDKVKVTVVKPAKK
ncbi:MAG: hypothetical protein A3G39_07540 [Deltaproteobacteria bacterium RIFCSPLOWO2_12_FULL_43_16]|nr:MAG: hypothetical protein A2Z89_07080 [Deltaproteobacteria bacterium GWA2_43_19]OGQ09515.1 MAG: hypothetical protein A3D30_06880 [Deltaproteobacteria bacterium RIFCSPHIGHO2_02_FULL_43_33]OGQ38733.1 MAG: hypothetical protein A3A85_02545 [Deltaproteobacteria bacterium RIFCSPLOWO2_01_FULL_42_9]OGQ58013.1 MAG: hypothetical protein A3G39_07540 [Deltaproteobacteria bacterium RIFCSPLOWO2_12_FULL_43_16]HBR18064.1 hypothetical protein [Deltaproteobacteria bacterium]